MDQPFLSVIVPCLNANATIEACIESLLSQTYPREKYEIIVIDNNSKDDSMEILNFFKGKIIVKQETKKGSYISRNQGIAIAKGELIAFIDSDCFARPDWLDNLVRVFQNEKVNLVGGKILAKSTKGYFQRFLNKYDHAQDSYFKAGVFATSNMAVRSNILRAFGIFDENLLSGADFEFSSRVAKSKEGLKYCDKAVVLHDYSSSVLKMAKKQFFRGKWQGIIRRKYGKTFFINGLDLDLIKNFGFFYFMIKNFLDGIFILGFLWGSMIPIKKYL